MVDKNSGWLGYGYNRKAIQIYEKVGGTRWAC